MRIAFARLSPDETGDYGDANYIDELASALIELGHEVEVVEGCNPQFANNAVPVIDAMVLSHLPARLDFLLGRDTVALVHRFSPAAEVGDVGGSEAQEAERWVLSRVRRAIATSTAVAARLRSELGISVQEVLPGVRALPRNQPAVGQTPVLSVGALTPSTGHEALLRAMARLTDLDWTLTIAGSARGYPAHASELAALIEEMGLSRRATLLVDPEPDAVRRAWETAGLFAAATQAESDAGPVAEALRRGIPVVVTNVSGATTLVPAEAGVVCCVDDPATFGKCLRRLLFDHNVRADMAENAWRTGQKLPSWNEQAQRFATVLRS